MPPSFIIHPGASLCKGTGDEGFEGVKRWVTCFVKK